MLRPESFHTETLDWAPSSSATSTARTKTQKRAVTEIGPQNIDAFLERLVPDGVSANKRAIIERLIARHLQESRYSA